MTAKVEIASSMHILCLLKNRTVRKTCTKHAINVSQAKNCCRKLTLACFKNLLNSS